MSWSRLDWRQMLIYPFIMRTHTPYPPSHCYTWAPVLWVWSYRFTLCSGTLRPSTDLSAPCTISGGLTKAFLVFLWPGTPRCILGMTSNMIITCCIVTIRNILSDPTNRQVRTEVRGLFLNSLVYVRGQRTIMAQRLCVAPRSWFTAGL